MILRRFRLLLILILFQPTAQLFGQDISVKAGLNVSSVAGLPEEGHLIAYHIGIGGKKDLTSLLSFRHEVIYSVQGTRIGASDARLLFHYLNMPMLLNVRSGEKISFDVGPQLGIALRALERMDVDTEVDKTANLETLEVSLCLGVNYRISQALYVDCRFNRGITNASRVPRSDNYHNAVFQASLGYCFNRKNQEPK